MYLKFEPSLARFDCTTCHRIQTLCPRQLKLLHLVDQDAKLAWLVIRPRLSKVDALDFQVVGDVVASNVAVVCSIDLREKKS